MYRLRHHIVNYTPSGATFFALAILLVGCGNTPPAEDDTVSVPHVEYERGPLSLRVSASADTISTTETLRLTVEATLDEGYNVQFPAYPENDVEDTVDENAENVFTLQKYEDAEPVLLDDGRVRRARTFFLDPFLDGPYTCPGLEVRYGLEKDPLDTWSKIDSDPLDVTVVSVLSADDTGTLEDIKGPVSVPNPTPWGWYAFWLLVAIAALGTFYYYRFVRVVPGPPPPPPLPPYKRALDALEAVRREKLVEQGLYKEYYIRVSDILRHFVEEQFGFPASERTTEEFLQGLQHNALLGLQEQLLLKEFLRHCDLVKFAKSEPSSEEIQHTFDTCKQFVEDTEAARKKAAEATTEGAH